MTAKNPKIEIRHDAINELLGSAPGWLIRWGTTVFFGVIIVLLTGAYFFKYPVVFKAPVVITTQQPAIWVVAQTNGKIDSIHVENGAYVNKNQVLAVIDNPAKTEDVLMLEQQLTAIRPYIVKPAFVKFPPLPQQIMIGELQDSYMQLLKLCREKNVFVEERYHERKLKSLQTELEQLSHHLQNLHLQSEAYKRNYTIVSEQYLRDSILHQRNISSAMEAEEIQKQKINSEIQLRQSQSVISSTEIEIARLQQNMVEFQTDYRMKQETLNNELTSAYELLCRNVLLWEEKYLLKAPLAGHVSFMNFWGSGQFINAGEQSFAIVPVNPGHIIGKCNVPATGLGKILKGQQVTVKLDEYPYMDYGMLQGRVSDISLISVPVATQTGIERVGSVEIILAEDSLKTTYKKEIPFTGELSGMAEIIVEDISLIEHLINPLKHLWSRRK